MTRARRDRQRRPQHRLGRRRACAAGAAAWRCSRARATCAPPTSRRRTSRPTDLGRRRARLPRHRAASTLDHLGRRRRSPFRTAASTTSWPTPAPATAASACAATRCAARDPRPHDLGRRRPSRYGALTRRLAPVPGTSSTETWDAFFSDFYLRAYADEERDARGRGPRARRGAARGLPGGRRDPRRAVRLRPALDRAGARGLPRHGRRPLAGAAGRGAAARGRRALAEADPCRLPRAAVRRAQLRRRAEPLHVARLPGRRGGREGPGRDPARAADGRAARARDDAPRPPRRRLARPDLAADGRGPAAARAAHVRSGDRRRADHPDADRQHRRARVAHVLRAHLRGDRAAGDDRARGLLRRAAPTARSRRAVHDDTRLVVVATAR